MQHFIGQTRNGRDVYVKLIGSEASRQIARQPQLLSLAKEMLEHITAHYPETNVEYDMKRSVGYSFVVPTTDKDAIFYGRLLKEDIHTRFVKNAKPRTTRYVTATLLRDAGGNFELTDIWIGPLKPPQPGSPNETIDSRLYWANHAIIFDNQHLQPQTITKVCPY